MKIMKKFVTFITIIAVVFVLVVPVQAEAGGKSAPKLNKTKVTLDLAGKKTKTYQLKVKGATGKITVKNTHKHHWAPYFEYGPKNIFGFVCYCGKVFSTGEEWEQHSQEEIIALFATGDPDIICNTPLQHNGFATGKAVADLSEYCIV